MFSYIRILFWTITTHKNPASTLHIPSPCDHEQDKEFVSIEPVHRMLPSLQANCNFLAVNLHFFWPRPLWPTEAVIQMFSFAFADTPRSGDATVS